MKINSETNNANNISNIQLIITLNKNDEPIPKQNMNEQLDADDVLRLKTLCANLENSYENSNIDNEDEDLKGFTKEIIKSKEEVDRLLKWIDGDGTNLRVKRLFKPTLEKNSWRDFHEACDKKGSTIVLCEEQFGKRFGGFTKVNWDTSGNKSDSSSFLFSLDKKVKFSETKNPGINCLDNYGPSFYSGTLTLICNEPEGKFFFIGQQHYTIENTSCYNVKKNELSGADRFNLKNMEIYQVIQLN